MERCIGVQMNCHPAANCHLSAFALGIWRRIVVAVVLPAFTSRPALLPAAMGCSPRLRLLVNYNCLFTIGHITIEYVQQTGW
jgi:hypothetical protein